MYTVDIAKVKSYESGNSEPDGVTLVLEFTVCQKNDTTIFSTLDWQYFKNLLWYGKPHTHRLHKRCKCSSGDANVVKVV